jgi:uncharacterized protein YjdB
MAGQTVTWHTSDSTKVTISPSTGATTIATGVAAGISNITATSGSVTSTAPSVVTVTGTPTPVLTTITISPTSQSINIGGVVQLSATCRDQNNAVMAGQTVTWHTSDSTKVTISPSTGATTIARGVAAGTSNITATSGSVTNTAPSVITVTGTVSTLTSIVIAPTSASIIINGTIQLIASCRDQTGATMSCQVTWSSSDIDKATVNSSGVVTGVSEGTANVTASVGLITSNSSAITVSTTLPQESGGGGIVLAIGAMAAAAILMSRKQG